MRLGQSGTKSELPNIQGVMAPRARHSQQGKEASPIPDRWGFFLVATHLGSQRCNEVALRFQAAWRHGPDPEPREEMQ